MLTDPVGSTGASTGLQPGGSTGGAGTGASTTADGVDDTSTGAPPDHTPPGGGLGQWGYGYVGYDHLVEQAVAGEFTGDEHLDLIARVPGTGQVLVGDGQGGLTLGTELEFSLSEYAFAAELNGQPGAELVVHQMFDTEVSIAFNRGGSFDWHGGLKLDEYVATSTLGLALGPGGIDTLFVPLVSHSALASTSGDGNFRWGATVSPPLCSQGAAAEGDLDGDGIDEVVALGDCGPGEDDALGVKVHGLLAGAFVTRQEIVGDHGAPYSTTPPMLIDVDHDGDLDVVIASEAVLHVLYNQGDGMLADAPESLMHGVTRLGFTVVPLRNALTDDWMFVFESVLDPPVPEALVVEVEADWTLHDRTEVDLQGRIETTGDFDGDGRPDVVTREGGLGQLRLWLSAG